MNLHIKVGPEGCPARGGWRRLALLGLLAVVGGCRYSEVVPDDYGSRRSFYQSVNGTDALANMFRKAGHRVRSWRFLSPSLREADVIVWFPDDLEPPSPEVERWLDDWLRSGDLDAPPRVLIYVGRDYTAAPLYWQSTITKAPATMQAEYRAELVAAKSDAAQLRNHSFSSTECEEWFTLEPKTTSDVVVDLLGLWADGVDGTQVTIERGHRLKPMEPFTTLLADDQSEPIVSEKRLLPYATYGGNDARLIMVENGSWLLSAALVNHEHRKLAGKLVAHVGPPRLDVVFLESGSGGPPIREKDPSGMPPVGIALFRTWPIGATLTQAALLGVLFTMMCWPIFGHPRRLRRRSLTDFGSHVAALGQLLRQTRDRRHAVQSLRLYWKSLDRKTGAVTPTTALAPEQLTSTRGPTAL